MMAVISNVIVVLMLGVAIFYMVKLRKELRVLKQGREQLEYASHNLLQATESAKQAIVGLRAHVDEKAYDLQDKIDEAQKLFEELSFMYNSADSLANRLEKLASQATAAAGLKQPEKLTESESPRPAATKTEKSDRIEKVVPKAADRPKSKAEAALMAAMRKKKNS